MSAHKSRNTAVVGMNFEHIVASIDMFSRESSNVQAQHSHYPRAVVINRHFDLPFEASDVQKHYALLESRTAMDVHAAEENERASITAVRSLRWNY